MVHARVRSTRWSTHSRVRILVYPRVQLLLASCPSPSTTPPTEQPCLMPIQPHVSLSALLVHVSSPSSLLSTYSVHTCSFTLLLCWHTPFFPLFLWFLCCRDTSRVHRRDCRAVGLQGGWDQERPLRGQDCQQRDHHYCGRMSCWVHRVLTFMAVTSSAS